MLKHFNLIIKNPKEDKKHDKNTHKTHSLYLKGSGAIQYLCIRGEKVIICITNNDIHLEKGLLRYPC